MEYRTPMGAFDTWEAAAQACEACDFDPVAMIEIVDPAEETLNERLAVHGYRTEPSRNGRKYIVDNKSNEVLFRGNAAEVWEWLNNSPHPIDLDEVAQPFELSREPVTVPQAFENNNGKQLEMFAKGKDWKPRHRDLFDVEDC